MSADKFLAQCFEGLRPLQGYFMKATKLSADGKVQVGGSAAWPSKPPIASPAGANKVTHHNCKDTASITVDDVRYELSDPVSPITPEPDAR